MVRHLVAGALALLFGSGLLYGAIRNTAGFNRLAIGRGSALFMSDRRQEQQVAEAHNSESYRALGVIGGVILIVGGILILFWIPPLNF